jgi:hypothetical protein
MALLPPVVAWGQMTANTIRRSFALQMVAEKLLAIMACVFSTVHEFGHLPLSWTVTNPKQQNRFQSKVFIPCSVADEIALLLPSQ